MAIKEIVRAGARDAWFFRDRIRFQRFVKKSDLPVVLCYSMGKVGSTSIFKTLKRTKFAGGTQHLHFLNSGSIPEVRDIHRRAGFRGDPAHLKAARLFIKVRSEISPSRLVIITAVRDPVGFAISNFFQNPYFFRDFKLPLVQDNAEEIKWYIENSVLEPNSSSFQYWNNWLVNELERVFNFKFFDHPFDQNKGWSVIQSDRAKIGCIQMEMLNEGFPNLAMSLVGEEINLTDRTANSRAHFHQYYRELVRRISVPKESLELIYQSPFVRYFYSNEQIEQFIRKWQ